MKISFLSIALYVIAPLVAVSLVMGYVWTLRDNEKKNLLNQFNQISAPQSNSILIDDAELIRYIKQYGPAPTMRVIIAAAHHAKIDCHDRAHQFGRLSYEEFGDEILKLNLPECHSGFYHGAIEAYFKKYGTDKLAEKLSFICPDHLNIFFTHQCRHGIGHGLMAWSSYDLPATLDYCGMITDDMGKASCRSGAFMENIVGSLTNSPEARARGHVSKYLSDDPQFPCTIVKDEYKADCYFLQTDRMLQLSTTGIQGVVDECLKAPSQYHYTCFASLGRTIGGLDRGKPEQAIVDCKLIPDQTFTVDCIEAVAKDYLWDPSGQEGGLHFCDLVLPEDGKRECYVALSEHARAVMNAEQLANFCAQVPTEVQYECLHSSP